MKNIPMTINCKKLIPFILFLLFLPLTLHFTVHILFIFSEKDNTNSNHTPLFPDSAAGSSHSPIVITSNAELIAFPEKKGSGTQSDPFIIEYFEIDGEGVSSPIKISNTNKPLIIQYFKLINSPASNDTGAISIESCHNITICGNEIYNIPTNGIYLRDSTDIYVYNNSFSKNNNSAIYVNWDCEHIQICDNLMQNSGDKDCVIINWADFVDISNNLINDSSGGGISSIGDHSNIISNRVFNVSSFAIYTDGQNYLIYDNIVNNSMGITVSSHYSTIENNTIDNFGYSGIDVWGDYNIIKGNSILYSEFNTIGIELTFLSSNNIVENNYIIYGEEGNCIVDDGTGNQIGQNQCVSIHTLVDEEINLVDFGLLFLPRLSDISPLGLISFLSSIFVLALAIIKFGYSIYKKLKGEKLKLIPEILSLIFAFTAIAVANLNLADKQRSAKGMFTPELILYYGLLLGYVALTYYDLNPNLKSRDVSIKVTILTFVFYVSITYAIFLLANLMEGFIYPVFINTSAEPIGYLEFYFIPIFIFLGISILFQIMIRKMGVFSKKLKQNIILTKEQKFLGQYGASFMYVLITLASTTVLLAPMTALFIFSKLWHRIKTFKKKKSGKDSDESSKETSSQKSSLSKDGEANLKSTEPTMSEAGEEKFIQAIMDFEKKPMTFLLFYTGSLVFIMSSVMPWLLGFHIDQMIPLWFLVFGYLCWVLVFFKFENKNVTIIIVTLFIIVLVYLLIDYPSNPVYMTFFELDFGELNFIFIYTLAAALNIAYILITIFQIRLNLNRRKHFLTTLDSMDKQKTSR